MKIVVVSTFDKKGGAAMACFRLCEAFRKEGHDVKLLVMEKTGDEDWVFEAAPQRKRLDRLQMDLQYAWTSRTQFRGDYIFSSSPWIGHNIAKHPLVLQADIINLHWINHGFLGIDDLEELFLLQKPVFWHMHDCWSFTGGCHYTGDCRRFEIECGHCPALRRSASRDLSAMVFNRKRAFFERNPAVFIGSSYWLTEEAKKSGLVRADRAAHIPIPIDTDHFYPLPKDAAKSKLKLNPAKKFILFAAMNAADNRKGFKELISALALLGGKLPEVEILVAGKAEDHLRKEIPFHLHLLGAVPATSMVDVYRAADLFVIPSKEDNLPNTVLESLACGTPVVGFRTGGIPEMIEPGRTGFLAALGDVEDLAEAILNGIALSNEPNTAAACVQSMQQSYSPHRSVSMYLDLVDKYSQ